MAEKVLKAKKRSELGSANSSRLRKDGFTPVVLYGKEYENTCLVLDTRDLNRLLAHRSVGSRIEINVEGTDEMALIKEVQRHPVRGTVLHADFLHLTAGQKVRVELSINVLGAENIDKELLVQRIQNEIEIEAFPKDLVDYINIDISGMGVGDTFTVEDIKLEDYPGIEILTETDQTLVVVTEPVEFVEPEIEDEDAEITIDGEEAEEGEETEEGEEETEE